MKIKEYYYLKEGTRGVRSRPGGGRTIALLPFPLSG
jgi:hypothetical protein